MLKDFFSCELCPPASMSMILWGFYLFILSYFIYLFILFILFILWVSCNLQSTGFLLAK